MFSSKLGQSKSGEARLDQILVAQQVRHLAVRRHVRAVGHRDEGLDRLHAPGDGLDQRQEASGRRTAPGLRRGRRSRPPGRGAGAGSACAAPRRSRTPRSTAPCGGSRSRPAWRRGRRTARRARPAHWPCGASAAPGPGRCSDACRLRRGARRSAVRHGGVRRGRSSVEISSGCCIICPFMIGSVREKSRKMGLAQGSGDLGVPAPRRAGLAATATVATRCLSPS